LYTLLDYNKFESFVFEITRDIIDVIRIILIYMRLILYKQRCCL
jgi:hypothetical protein